MVAEVQHSGLKQFPIMTFSIVMGLSGFVIMLEKASFLFGFPDFLWLFFLLLDALVFAGVMTAYALKAGWHPEEVASESRHPVKMNFLPTIPISFLLLSIAFYNEINPFLAFAFWWIGMLGQLASLLFVVPHWIRHPFKIEHLNPAWFIPIVGTLLVPIVGVDAAPPAISIFFFFTGLFFWPVLLSIVLYRLIFHEPPAERFVPTLFILVAPPAVALIAYFRITGVVDFAAYGLHALALLFLLVLLALARHFLQVRRFYLSWWAYVFPLDAFTIASMLIYEVNRSYLFAVLSLSGLAIATAVFAWVGWESLRQARRGSLLVEN